MLTAQNIADVSPFALAGAVCLMLLAESLSPLVPLLPGKTRAQHALRNVTIALCTSLFAVGGNFLLVGVAAWTHLHQKGLLNLLEAPWWVHHSRDVGFTDTNFGTLFTWWDRAFGTFSPGHVHEPQRTGLEGFDSPEAQSLLGVLTSPLRS